MGYIELKLAQYWAQNSQPRIRGTASRVVTKLEHMQYREVTNGSFSSILSANPLLYPNEY